jgi:hypothetical protein
MDGVVHGRGHVLGPVAAAFRAELGEMAEHLVHVAGEVVGARHVGVADVAVGHERDAQVGRGRPSPMRRAMDQMRRLAPSMRPPMLPVVSSTKATSTRGPAAIFCSAAIFWPRRLRGDGGSATRQGQEPQGQRS